jgi:hypothetical protein
LGGIDDLASFGSIRAQNLRDCGLLYPRPFLLGLRNLAGRPSLAHLYANLKAVDVTFTSEQAERLDVASKSVLNFPADFLTRSPSISHAGVTVNGVPSERIFLVPEDDGFR